MPPVQDAECRFLQISPSLLAHHLRRIFLTLFAITIPSERGRGDFTPPIHITYSYLLSPSERGEASEVSLPKLGVCCFLPLWTTIFVASTAA